MKKSTKQLIIVLFIILMFGMSTIAFVVTGIVGNTQQQQQQFRPLESTVVEGDLDPVYESTYIQKGFTWLKFYYTEADAAFLSFIDSLPSAYTTNNGQTQLIVQKINSAYGSNSNYIIVSSQQGVEELTENDESEIVQALCRLLTVVPAECAFVSNATAIGLPPPQD